MDLLDPARFDRRDQGRMGVEREARRHLALQPQLLAIGRQQKLDRRGIEADAVVQPLDAIGRVDALDRQHGGQDLAFGDRRGIAGEQRLDEERLVRLDDEMHPVGRDVDARHLVDDLVHLGDDDAVLEGGGLHDGRRVLGVRPGIEISLPVGTDRGDQRDVRREVDEIAGEQFEIGVHRTELDLATEQHGRDARRLRSRIGEVELLGDARVEQVEMFGQDDAGLHHVQVVHLGAVDGDQRGAERVRLLLVVAFQADPVARPQDGLQQARGVARRDDLALREFRAGLEAGLARVTALLPIRRHIRSRTAFACPRSETVDWNRRRSPRHRRSPPTVLHRAPSVRRWPWDSPRAGQPPRSPPRPPPDATRIPRGWRP